MKNLTSLDLSGNQLSGPLPSSLGQMQSLEQLVLSRNQLSGQLPPSVGQMKNLTSLDLSDNQLSGPLSSSLIGKMQSLQQLDLSQNRLFDALPFSLGQMQSLQHLDLSRNQLSGQLPSSVGQMKNLTYLDLSVNLLSGQLPPSLEHMKSLERLSLSGNQLTGPLPTSLGQMKSLALLYLADNQLSGPLPASLGQMENLKFLDLSYNHLSGPLPSSLLSLPNLVFLNVSYNRLRGSIPAPFYDKFSSDSFLGNPRLAPFSSTNRSKYPERPPASKWSRIAVLVCAVAMPVSCLLVSLCVWRCCFKKQVSGLDFVAPHYKVWTAEEMRVATNNFDAANVIGSGATSTCYLGTMKSPEGILRLVALKRLTVDDYDGEDNEIRQSFVTEFKTLCKLRHRNLVKVLGYCVEGGERALAMEYVEGGDLDRRLHMNVKAGSHKLTWEERVNVALDVAEGLVYLHHENGQPIIHCDLKPKNILLRADMVAKISDFGIARLMDVNERGDMSVSKLRGSFGYIAPEYGMGLRISTKVDVYSYGVLLLELVIGMRPTSSMFKARSLRTWADKLQASEQHMSRALRYYDLSILHEAKELLKLGMQCTHNIAKERPTMYVVRDFLLKLKKARL